MANRTAGKLKKQAKKTPRRAAGSGGDVRSKAASPPQVDLAKECAKLRTELDAAQARLDVMEAQRKELLDRINWAIDSLSALNDA